MVSGNQDVLQRKKIILITSALPYVNNIPHLGNLIGCVLSADVFSRFCKSWGCDTFFVMGTDEHGTTTEAKAIEEGITPKEVTDKYFKIHQKIYEWFQFSYDGWGRSSSKTNHELSQEIFKKLDQNGYIIEDDLEQMYDQKAGKFLADRFVEGTCPKCKFESARGDQCDGCGSMLDPTDLINPISKLTGTMPEVRTEKHLFVDLPKISTKLQKWIDSEKKYWSKNAVSMTEAWMKTGLKKRCITRDLKWGVSVPKKGYEHKVFYSWFDAPIAYISITKESTKKWKEWWHDPENVQLYQFMGKDNIPFHTIMFPSFLIGANDNYTLLHQISSTEYLNYEDGQFSKSRGVGVFGNHAIESGIPVDVWRYYLLANRPETSDTEFRWEDFQARNNNELLANFGNFVNRTLTFVNKNYSGKIVKSKEDVKFRKKCIGKLNLISKLLSTINLRDAIHEIMMLSKLGNQYFQENKPWETFKNDKQKCDSTMFECVNLVRKLAIVIESYLPVTSSRIFLMLGIKSQTWQELDKDFSGKIGKVEILFKKFEDDEIVEWRRKYGGQFSDSPTEEKNVFPLQLAVGKIENVKDHANADSLFIFDVNFGKLGRRQVVTSLKKFFSREVFEGKKLVFCLNLKPAKFRGEESNAMILGAGDDEETVLLEMKGSDVGDNVNVEGMESSSTKIEFKEFGEVELEVIKGKVTFNGKVLKSSKQEVLIKAKEGTRVH